MIWEDNIPLKRARKSIWGSSGPGTDSIPVEPERNPALAATHPKKQNFFDSNDVL